MVTPAAPVAQAGRTHWLRRTGRTGDKLKWGLLCTGNIVRKFGMDSLGNMKTLDRWRQAIGLAYEADRRGVAADRGRSPFSSFSPGRGD